MTTESSATPVTRTVLLAGAGPMLEMATMALFPQLEGETIPGWFTRLFEADGLELEVEGRRVAVVPVCFGSAAVRSIFDWLSGAGPLSAKAARLARRFPAVDGVLFVADSWRHSLVHSVARLAEVQADLARAGRDPGTLPFVFQLDRRHLAASTSLARMREALRTPRCAHIEAVSAAGHGAHRALPALLDLIEARPPEPCEPGGVDRSPLPSPHALFEDRVRALTADGECRERLAVERAVASFRLAERRLGVVRGWPRRDAFELPFPSGVCEVDKVTRTPEVQTGTGWKAHDARVVAARVRAAGTRSERLLPLLSKRQSVFEPFVLLGPPKAVDRAEQDRVAQAVYSGRWECGVLPVRLSSRGLSILRCPWFVPAPHDGADLVIVSVGTDNEVHFWVGIDARDRVVELIVVGDEGAALLDPPP